MVIGLYFLLAYMASGVYAVGKLMVCVRVSKSIVQYVYRKGKCYERKGSLYCKRKYMLLQCLVVRYLGAAVRKLLQKGDW